MGTKSKAACRAEVQGMDIRVRTVIHLMNKLRTDELSICLISRNVNLSPSRLRQLFKKETGLSPMQYLRQLRMRNAEELLRSTFLSVKEIVFASGMRDVSHFVRDFKTRHGLTPTEFRTQSESQPADPIAGRKFGE
jgi:AraC-like DNA-binding protein